MWSKVGQRAGRRLSDLTFETIITINVISKQSILSNNLYQLNRSAGSSGDEKFRVMVVATHSLVLRFYGAKSDNLKYNIDLRWTLSSIFGNTYIQAKGTSATKILYTDRHGLRLSALQVVRGRDDSSLDDIDCCRFELTGTVLGWSGEDTPLAGLRRCRKGIVTVISCTTVKVQYSSSFPYTHRDVLHS